jgi:hypothetical protein
MDRQTISYLRLEPVHGACNASERLSMQHRNFGLEREIADADDA